MEPVLPGLFEGRIFTTAEALAAGFTTEELRRALRQGLLVRLRHGVHIAAEAYASTAGVERHRLAVRAHLLKLDDATVASHRSAASLLGLSLLHDAKTVHCTRPGATRRRSAGLDVSDAPLPDEHCTLDGTGVRVTSAARTVLDVARTTSFREAVVVADSALFKKLATLVAVREVLEYQRCWRGSPGAGRVVAAADGRAESPGESLTRLDLHALGYTDVEPQLVVSGASGRAYRGDLVLRKQRVIVEFDGMVKYAGDDKPGRLTLEAEKAREDDLRAMGWTFVRLVWSDLGRLPLIEQKIRVALASAQMGRAARAG